MAGGPFGKIVGIGNGGDSLQILGNMGRGGLVLRNLPRYSLNHYGFVLPSPTWGCGAFVR